MQVLVDDCIKLLLFLVLFLLLFMWSKPVNKLTADPSVIKIKVSDRWLSGSEIVASDCWPSVELLEAVRVICHVWSRLSAVSTTVGASHRSSSSFSLAPDETNFRKHTAARANVQKLPPLVWLKGLWQCAFLKIKRQLFWYHCGKINDFFSAEQLVRVHRGSIKECRDNLRLPHFRKRHSDFSSSSNVRWGVGGSVYHSHRALNHFSGRTIKRKLSEIKWMARH